MTGDGDHPGDGPGPDDHVRAWADLHRTEPPGGFVGGWLRASAAVARPLARAGVSPNAVTVAAMVVGVAAFPLALAGGWAGPLAAAVAVTVSGLLDSLDGAVAVQAGRATRVGFLLDSALDRLADAAYPAALAVVAADRGAEPATAAALAVAATAAAWWLEYVRARASLAASDAPPAGRRQVVTPGERPTRIVLAAVGLALPPLALAALWGQVLVVGASGGFLLAHALNELRRLDRAAPRPPGPTG